MVVPPASRRHSKTHRATPSESSAAVGQLRERALFGPTAGAAACRLVSGRPARLSLRIDRGGRPVPHRRQRIQAYFQRRRCHARCAAFQKPNRGEGDGRPIQTRLAGRNPAKVRVLRCSSLTGRRLASSRSFMPTCWVPPVESLSRQACSSFTSRALDEEAGRQRQQPSPKGGKACCQSQAAPRGLAWYTVSGVCVFESL